MSQLELFSTPDNKSKSKKTGQKSLFDDLPDTPKTRQTSEHSSVDKTADKSDMETPQDLNHPSVEELANEIHRHNVLYNGGKTEISDAQFDALTQKLRNLEPNHPVLSELTTPEVHSNGKVVHETPMLSLEKAEKGKEMEQIANWLKSFTGDFIATPKIDGLACSLRYDEQGRLKVAATRGNGTVGENITKNALYIQGVPHQIAQSGLEIRGEVYMPLTAFKAFDGEKRSARNLAVGGLKQKDATETSRYGLCFFAYDVQNLHILGDDAPKTESQKYELLQKLGFTTVDVTPFTRTIAENSENKTASMILAEIQAYCDDMELHRSEWNFDADGLVFKVDDIKQQNELGKTDHHPKCAIAYKFNCDTGKTILRSVEWQLAKGGTITPVAHFDPILLAGAMVQRASLSNAGQIRNFKTRNPALSDAEFNDSSRAEEDKFIPQHLHIGAELLASRRGDVIPHVEYVISTPENTLEVIIPDKCPSCGAPVVDDDVFLRCSDPDNCPSTGQALIENYAKVTGIMGLGEKIIESLYDAGAISTPADLYRLDLAQIAQAVQDADDDSIDLTAKLPQKLYDSIQNTRKMDLATFIEALSIPSIGKVTAKKLESHYISIQELFERDMEYFVKCLSSIDKEIKCETIENIKQLYHQLKIHSDWDINTTIKNGYSEEFKKTIEKLLKTPKSKEKTRTWAEEKTEDDFVYKVLIETDMTYRIIIRNIKNMKLREDESIDSFVMRCVMGSDDSNVKPPVFNYFEQNFKSIDDLMLTNPERIKHHFYAENNKGEQSIDSLNRYKLIHRVFEKLTALPAILKEFGYLLDTKLFVHFLFTNPEAQKDAMELIKNYQTIETLHNATEKDIYLCLYQGKLKRKTKVKRKIYHLLERKRGQIDDLLQFVEVIPVLRNDNMSFSGKSFLFTGSLQSMKREEAEARVKALGGTIAGSVKKDLSVLVATSQTTTKWKKAEDLNQKGSHIQLLTEDEFLKLLEEAESSNSTES